MKKELKIAIKNSSKENMKTRVSQVPTKPGVYLFRNSDNKIIYIGKAKNLRNRVRSYFQNSRRQSSKTQSLIRHIDHFDWIVVGSEVEALITEANLIKKHRPRYNIDLKDDKSFPFIRITKEPFPRVFITRNIIRDGSRYFGPYTGVSTLRMSIAAVQKVFQVRTCNYYMDHDIIANRKISLCLDYHIKKCEGPCEVLVSQDDYNKMIKRIIQFLQGDTKKTEEFLDKMMAASSRDLRFEDAAGFRDQLEAVKVFKKHQRKISANFDDRDVFAIARENNYGVLVILRIRQGRLFSREELRLVGEDKESIILENVITRFYLEGDFIPKYISLPVKPRNHQELIQWLKSKRKGALHFLYPERGEKAREIRLAYQNAKLLLGEWILERKKHQDYIPKSVNQLQDDLNLKAPPRRIEAFDISHLGGTGTVASMVCFVDGKPVKKEYRKYDVRTVEGIDDFAAMKEIVTRRYNRLIAEQKSLPDLILIDGGKGQLSITANHLKKMKLGYIPIIGLAKRLEEVFLPGHSEPQSIPKQSPGLILLRRIRDEAHRFAINFQRQKRTKGITSSIFEDIPGMGKKRVSELLTKFDSVQDIAKSDPNRIAEKTGIPIVLCESTYKMAKDQILKESKIQGLDENLA